jgi:hypothetical protein
MAISMNIDKEWENFISSSYNHDMSSDDEDEINEIETIKSSKPNKIDF